MIANITSQDYFTQTLITKKMVSTLFSFISKNYYNDPRNKPDLELTLNSVLISFLNLSRLNYGLIQALAQEKLVYKLTDLILENNNPIWLGISFLILSNMMISKEMVSNNSFLIERTFLKIEWILDPKNQEKSLISVSFLKLLHNMMISEPEFINRPSSKNALEKAIEVFLNSENSHLKSIILNTLNILFMEKV